MGLGYFAEIIFEVFMEIGGPAFMVGVSFARGVDQALSIDVPSHLLVGEVASQVRIPEWVVVGQRHLADVVAVNEGLLVFGGGEVLPAHSIKLKILINYIINLSDQAKERPFNQEFEGLRVTLSWTVS